MASIEILGYFFTVMVMLLAVLQLFVAAYAGVSATNAARAAARVSSLGGGGGEAAALAALAPGLQDGATVAVGGGAAVVAVEIPVLLFHGTSVGTITRTAQMPAAAGPGGDLDVLAAAGTPPAATSDDQG